MLKRSGFLVSNFIIVTVTSCFWEDWLWRYSFTSSWIAVLSGFYHIHTCKLYAAYYYLLPGYFSLIEGSKNLVSWVGPEMPRAAWSWLHALMIQKRAINDQAVVGEVQFISASYLEYLYSFFDRRCLTPLITIIFLRNSR